MNSFFRFDAPSQQLLAAGIVLLGLASVWRGLLGEGGLARRRVSMLTRLEGWRLTLVGLILVGLGAAWFWDVRWLLVLSLGIGFVEIQEATRVINAWRWSAPSAQRSTTARTRATSAHQGSNSPRSVQRMP